MRRTAALTLAFLCPWFTGSRPARADQARSRSSAGPEARLGTAAGFSEVGDASVATLGGEVAVGYQFGRLTVEATLDSLAMLHFVEDRSRNRDLGRLDRVGVNGRLVVVELGKHTDTSSVLRLYVEGGVGRQHGRWTGGLSFGRDDLSAGGGWILDHPVQQLPGGLPFRWLGWQFGWRFTRAQGGSQDDAVAARVSCTARSTGGADPCHAPMPGTDSDMALVVTSSFTATW